MYSVRLTKDIAKSVGNAGKQVRFAIAVALTRTARDVLPALYAQMRQDFDRPTPYSMNSFYVKPATKESLVAEVLPKTDTSNSGSPADKYLAPEIYGGDRKLKRMELRLQRMGLMRSDQYAVPGKGAGLDAYGNISRGQVTRLLTQLGALSESTGSTISPARLKRLKKEGRLLGRGFGAKRTTLNSQYFVARSRKSGEPLGVYVLLSRGNVQPVLVFVKKPVYQQRLQWGEVAERVVQQRFHQNFAEAMEQAIATSR